jgi:hypothetical protein
MSLQFSFYLSVPLLVRLRYSFAPHENRLKILILAITVERFGISLIKNQCSFLVEMRKYHWAKCVEVRLRW